MMRAIRFVFVAIFVLGSTCLARPATAHKGCHLLKRSSHPYDVATNGSIDGVPAAVLVDYNGGTSLSMDVIVYWDDHGLSMKTITPADHGDKIEATLAGGKLYTFNAVYKMGDSHAGPSAYAVQQFGLSQIRFEQRLRREFIRYVATPDESDLSAGCPAGMLSSRDGDAEDAFMHYLVEMARRHPSARYVAPISHHGRHVR